MTRSRIRPANEGDASSLAVIAIEVWANTYLRNGVNAFFADYALGEFTAARFGSILSHADQTIWVSENEVGIDGFIQISLNTEPPIDGCSDLEISRLYVQPRHQGSGVGVELLVAGLEFCRTTGRSDVWLAVNAENIRATQFYLKNGFEHAGETQFRIGQKSYPNHVLRYGLA